MLQAKPGRSGKQLCEQNSPNLGPAFQSILVVQCKATHLLLEGDAVPDELLGEDHAVLHVHVPVGHPVHQEQPLDVPRALAAAVAAADQAARLVPGKVVLGQTEVALRVGAR